ncbi:MULTISPECIES: HU family DNA-binding protein [Aequorivita]|uniref:HU family DNA-binding protein n=1 Tax=Aequorivita iocasae TaxID=2803865 RepID=A0ABX7DUM2_9FLAO|nr:MULTISPECIES: HU family DNA-binding protein [Aequorivita]PHR14785.1 MAG: DNA-binding protein [Aequorivita sp.]QQX76854.1 HU family DNA-binding protein [Aequorivita iocasae]UCA56326.1 HU family DNA-binding protein [Aequorivita sp. F7]
MPIKYKVVQRAEPGVAGGGTRKWYASMVNDGEMTIDDLVSEIEKFSALSEPDIKGVIIALENVIQKALSDSKVVRLEKLGSLYPSISSGPADTQDDFVANSMIKKVSVRYRAGKRILDAMKNAGFKKVAER